VTETVARGLVTEIRFGGTPAYVVEPDGAAEPRPGVVYAHGGTGPGKHIFLWQALELARAGFTVLLADTSLQWRGDPDADRETVMAAVETQRRALDVLEERGATRVGFFGHSLGGMQGAILSVVEPRLDAIVIAAIGTGVTDWLRATGDYDESYLEHVDRLDPRHFVSVPGRRQLLCQHGRTDESVPFEAGRALYEAAAEPKRWLEYDCGHGVDGHRPALADRVAFFRETLVDA
jgi:pimeloyl-ACP methyl ester carboxylesterase